LGQKTVNANHLAAGADKNTIQYSITSHAYITGKSTFLREFCQIENAKVSFFLEFAIGK